MDIRFVNDSDTPAVRHIWKTCFNDADAFMDLYFGRKYNCENTLGIYHSGELVSNLQMLPYKMNLRGQIIDISYIVGVATLPEMRNNGYARALMNESLSVMRNKGHMLGILLPFNYEFYKKCGWENCYMRNKYDMPLADIAGIAGRGGNIRPVDINQDLPELVCIYNRYVLGKNSYIVRDECSFDVILQDMFQQGDMCYIIEDDVGFPEGYIMCKVKDGALEVHEIAYKFMDNLRALLHFACTNFPDADRFIWTVADNDMLTNILLNPKSGATRLPFLMARIIDAVPLLDLLAKGADNFDAFTLQISDADADWNNITVRMHPGGAEACDTDLPDIECDIATLTQIVAGHISPIYAYRMELLEYADMYAAENMDKLFGKMDNFINDYY